IRRASRIATRIRAPASPRFCSSSRHRPSEAPRRSDWRQMYAVILAGGGGTRLWPLSRPETPKPFLPLTGDRSLLQIAVDRIVDHDGLPLGRDDVTVVTDRRYAGLVRAQVPGVGIVAEPSGRNTAAAVTLATLSIDRADDEVMVVLPADQLIAGSSEC